MRTFLICSAKKVVTAKPKLFTIHQLTQNVAYQYMHFLSAGRDLGRHGNAFIAQRGHFATACGGHAHAVHTLGFGQLDGLHHIGAVAAGGNAHQHVASLSQRLHLAHKNLVIAIIIAHRG